MNYSHCQLFPTPPVPELQDPLERQGFVAWNHVQERLEALRYHPEQLKLTKRTTKFLAQASEYERIIWALGREVDLSEPPELPAGGVFKHPIMLNIINAKTHFNAPGRPCPKCGSTDTTMVTIQTRSGDEGADNFINCNTCNKKYRI